ncbi:MAG: hypothetical protein KBH07_00530 [Flavobacteriales bacterium]|nr:hypothetical protein [Flavobacteriales bacterium]MBP9079475.1 hypothetical protein [Flavobacteriales bacterium]
MAAKPRAKDPKELIVDLLAGRSGMKQDVYARSKENFALLKLELKALVEDLAATVSKRDPRLKVEFSEQGDFSAKVVAAGDTVVFTMHTNVFRLDQGNSLWKTSYLQEDEHRGYFGVVNVYNFLSDSFRYNRERDLGYLVARLFINKEGHFFLQGKKQLGFLYNDLPASVMDRSRMQQVLASVLLYVLDFDLLAPPYDQVSQVSVEEMKQLEANSMVSTGKRLGFRFQADTEEIS